MTRRPKLALVAAVAALSLTGCAGLRPGVAAEVGDQQITLDELDDFAAAFCTYLATTQSGEQNSKGVRQGALATMVHARLGHLYAERNPATIDREVLDANLAGVEEATADLPEAEQAAFLEEVSYFLEGDQYLNQAGDGKADLISELVEEYDVELDPRFGTWEEIQDREAAVAVSGSLSVPVEAGRSDPDDPTAGPIASQKCS